MTDSIFDYGVWKGVKYNKTTLYLLPSINLNKGELPFKYLMDMGFLNCYLEWEECVEIHKNCIYCLFNPKPETLYNGWEYFTNRYKRNRNYVASYDIDMGLIMLVFRISESLVHLPRLLKNGQYSKFPKQYAFDNFTMADYRTGMREEKKQYKIIMKKPEIKEKIERELDIVLDDNAEFDSIPDMNDEVFSYEKFKKRYEQI